MASAADRGVILLFAAIDRRRLQRRSGNATIPRTVSFSRTLHRLLTFAFAAWMSLCCCEKRILAHAIEGEGRAAPSCCADACCAESGGGQDQNDHPRNCSDGCCVKTCHAPQPFMPDVDAVGAPMLAIPEFRHEQPRLGRLLAHDDRNAGEPPPRLALIISRRLRI